MIEPSSRNRSENFYELRLGLKESEWDGDRLVSMYLDKSIGFEKLCHATVGVRTKQAI